MKLSDSTRRSLRTLYQGLLSLLVAVPLISLYVPTGASRLAVIAASVVAAAAVITKIINALEDKGLIPAFLKAPASDGAKPVPDA
jgi:hypothetical protein